MQIFQVFFDDEALFLREIDSPWDWRDGRFLVLLRQNWVARRKAGQFPSLPFATVASRASTRDLLDWRKVERP